MADLTESIRLDGTNTDALYNRGLMFARIGELNKAIEDFGAVIRARPAEAATHKLRAEALRELGHSDQAINDLRQATKLDPSDSESAEALNDLLQESH